MRFSRSAPAVSRFYDFVATNAVTGLFGSGVGSLNVTTPFFTQ